MLSCFLLLRSEKNDKNVSSALSFINRAIELNPLNPYYYLMKIYVVMTKYNEESNDACNSQISSVIDQALKLKFDETTMDEMKYIHSYLVYIHYRKLDLSTSTQSKQTIDEYTALMINVCGNEIDQLVLYVPFFAEQNN